MLQQTQVKTVIPYWERWMRALPTIQALARARPEKVLKLWEGLGYYTRARNLQEAAKLLVREQGGQFPTAFDDVLALPGIGRYTAGAICSIAYNQSTPVLDGNVTRVLSRVFGIGEALPRDVRVRMRARNAQRPTSNARRSANAVVRSWELDVECRTFLSPATSRKRAIQERLWLLAERLVRLAAAEPARGRRNCSDLNQALMELGAVTCTPRNPRCPACPLKRHCSAFPEPGCNTDFPVGVSRRLEKRRCSARFRVPIRVRTSKVKPTRSPPGAGRVNRPGEPVPNAAQPKRPRTTPKHVVAFVIERNGRFLVRQRPPGVVNGQLWEFPNAEVRARPGGRQRALRELFGLRGVQPEKLLRLKHSITRYRITLDVYRLQPGHHPIRPGTHERWCSPKELRRLPFPGAHRRIVEHLLASDSGRRRRHANG